MSKVPSSVSAGLPSITGLQMKAMFAFSQTAATTNKKNNIIGSQQIPFDRWRIVRGDKVAVISGKDTGKSGTVIRVYRKMN